MAYGVSNSFKRFPPPPSLPPPNHPNALTPLATARGTPKTYTRQLARFRAASAHSSAELTRPIKRIRMDATGNVVEETVSVAAAPRNPIAAKETTEGVALASSSTAPSSPLRRRAAATLFSDDDDDDAPRDTSPPSSPPLPRLPSPIARGRKPAFAFLKRKREGALAAADGGAGDAHAALMEIAENVGGATTMETGGVKTRKRKLTQMQIDLGGEARRACKTCGMDYIPSNAEDAGLHKKFHAMNVGGVWMRKGCLAEMKKKKVVGLGERRLSGGQAVVVVDGRSSAPVRLEAKRVLEVVNTELSAVAIADKELWGHASGSSTSKRKSVGKRGKDSPALMEGGDRFKVYLYIDRNTCVGLCLAEKIEHAYRVIGSYTGGDKLPKKVASLPRSSSISTSESAEVALLGISRIWTSASHRRKGIAAALLDAARRNFFYGMEVPKAKMAFSQPTESGGQLAEHWFGAPAGWLVYAEAY